MAAAAPDLDDLARRVRDGERAALARAITLVESRKGSHRRQAAELLQALLPATGGAWRVGITGVPGVGKSTTIERLGQNLMADGHKVAVLAVDPSSSRTGGSILGDKTRMASLASDDRAFVRPSPSGGTLGGVAARTRESMLLCEAAGFDVVIVETVGTGQSETAVADMVDVFVLLALPGAGDELQGIKKGVLELADVIAVNKADGDNAGRARSAASELKAALHILTPASPDWTPQVVTISGLANLGLDTLWETVAAHRAALRELGGFEARRRRQQVKWMRTLLEERLLGLVRGNREIAGRLGALEDKVAAGEMTPALAVEELAQALGLPETML